MTSAKSVDDILVEAIERAGSMQAPLQERLQIVAEAARVWNPSYSEAIDAMAERVSTNGAHLNAPNIGEEFPHFQLPDDHGRLVSLSDLTAAGPVAVVFNRGNWCPFCRMNTISLSEASQEIQNSGGNIVAITPDKRRHTASIKTELNVPFSILTDLDNGYAASLNLAIWLGREIYEVSKNTMPEDERFQTEAGAFVPIPATFVVGTDGVVRDRFIDPDYRHRMDMTRLLKAMRQAG